MCRRLLEDTGVAILPGGDFGCSPEELTARLAYVDFNGKAAIEALEGPFDFVFSDADKHWYKNYGKGKLKYTPNGKQKYIGNGKQKYTIESEENSFFLETPVGF